MWKNLTSYHAQELAPGVDGSSRQPNKAYTEGETMELPSSSTSNLYEYLSQASNEIAQTKLAQCTIYDAGRDPVRPVGLDDNAM